MTQPRATSRRPWTLRAQLIAVVGAVAVLTALLLGLVSTLALRSSLLGQVDEALHSASERSSAGPGGAEFPRQTTDGTTPTDPGSSEPGGDDLAWGSEPPGLNVRGQATGTVVVELDGEEVTNAAYLDSSGEPQDLTEQQTQALLAAQSTPTWITLPDLGTYRGMAAERPDGTTTITALPWQDAADTLRSYIAVELAVGAGVLLLALAVATPLVRRSLRPLDRVARTAARVSELPLDRGDVAITERVPQADTDERTEVGKVGAAVNRMLGHVESSLAARHRSETKVRAFVADASHELRTPLASIRGYSDLVLRRGQQTGELSPDTEHAIGRVSAEGRRMQTLVEDLLLLARLDAGRELAQAEVDLLAIALDATSDGHAAGPDHRWKLDVPDEGVRAVVGDEPRLRQVLANLLTNARVHTPAGTSVTTALRDVVDPRLGAMVRLTVTDDGPGIAEELQPALFDRFTRGDAARGRGEHETSTGLGLAIVDAIVTAHGGTLAVVSRPGLTRFTVTLPAA